MVHWDGIFKLSTVMLGIMCLVMSCINWQGFLLFWVDHSQVVRVVVIIKTETPLQKVTYGIPAAYSITSIGGQQVQWSTNAKVWGIVLRVAWYGGCDYIATNNPLKAPGCTLLYLCLPRSRCSSNGDCYFPVTHGTLVKKTRNKNLSKLVTLWYTNTFHVSHRRGPASIAYHSRELFLPKYLRVLSI